MDDEEEDASVLMEVVGTLYVTVDNGLRVGCNRASWGAGVYLQAFESEKKGQQRHKKSERYTTHNPTRRHDVMCPWGFYKRTPHYFSDLSLEVIWWNDRDLDNICLVTA